jgi:hypothetical protein
MRILVSAVVLLAAAGPAAAAPDSGIPARFHGEWAVRLENCALRGGDNTDGMTIKARAIGHYEESVAIKRVTVLGRDSVRYEGILSSYDGEEPVTHTLKLSPDGARLIEAGYSDGPNSKAPDLLRCTR